MITLPLYVLPLVYAAVLLAAVLLLWLGYAWRGRRHRRNLWLDLTQCRLCAEWLRHSRKVTLFRCPSCGALNEHNFINDI